MIDLETVPYSWAIMLLLAAIFGIFGGLAYQLHQKHRGDSNSTSSGSGNGSGANDKMSWIANPFLGAVAAIAILYAFPPQVPTITHNSDGTNKVSYAYDVVKLISLSLIVGYAGGSILESMEARVLARVNEQKIQTVTAEKDVMQSKLEQVPVVTENLMNKIVQPVVEEHIKEAASEMPSEIADKLKKPGVVDDQAKQLIEEAQPTVNLDKRLDSVQDALNRVVNEVAESVQSPVEKPIEGAQKSTTTTEPPSRKDAAEGPTKDVQKIT